jgi:electron transfer flavoprotein alpha subunit
VVIAREGVLGAGSDEAVAECGGRALVVGTHSAAAAEQLRGIATELRLAETGPMAPAAWATALARALADEPQLVFAASPDGRDLAPRVALAMRRRALLNAAQITEHRVTLVRGGGTQMHIVTPPAAFVATLVPGVRGVERGQGLPAVIDCQLEVADAHDALVEGVTPPDAATVDLAEAPRIVGGGAGLDSDTRFAQLAELGRQLGASLGATRVITDRHWIDHERQIGTTGVVVNPQLYVAFGISGAVQHTSGLGSPKHIISVNTDPHCPMMQLADLAVVSDANLVLDELTRLLA